MTSCSRRDRRISWSVAVKVLGYQSKSKTVKNRSLKTLKSAEMSSKPDWNISHIQCKLKNAWSCFKTTFFFKEPWRSFQYEQYQASYSTRQSFWHVLEVTGKQTMCDFLCWHTQCWWYCWSCMAITKSCVLQRWKFLVTTLVYRVRALFSVPNTSWLRLRQCRRPHISTPISAL